MTDKQRIEDKNAMLTDEEKAAMAARGQDWERGDWVCSFTGRKMYPMDPRVGDIAIEDIAHHLSMICRYGGAASRFYSVAEHSIIVSRYVPASFALEGLLHDASEYVLGDMVRPLKYQPTMAAYRAIEARWEETIAERFDLGIAAYDHVKAIDDRILADERAALLPHSNAWKPRDPLGAVIVGFDPRDAEALFLERFEELRRDR